MCSVHAPRTIMPPQSQHAVCNTPWKNALVMGVAGDNTVLMIACAVNEGYGHCSACGGWAGCHTPRLQSPAPLLCDDTTHSERMMTCKRSSTLHTFMTTAFSRMYLPSLYFCDSSYANSCQWQDHGNKMRIARHAHDTYVFPAQHSTTAGALDVADSVHPSDELSVLAGSGHHVDPEVVGRWGRVERRGNRKYACALVRCATQRKGACRVKNYQLAWTMHELACRSGCNVHIIE